jgi:short-subunit dehydrogenase
MKAVVSGGSKGIGKAVVLQLAKQGYSVAFAARGLEGLAILKSELTKKYPKQEFIATQCNFAKKEDIKNFTAQINWQNIDVLVNNVGGFVQDSFLGMDENRLQQVLNVNLLSHHYLTKALQNKISEGAHIFNILSNLSMNIRDNATAYTVAKHAQMGLHKTMKDECRKIGVKVTGILPGSVSTASWNNVPFNPPREQFIQPEDIAALISCNLKLSKNCLVEDIIVNPMDKNWI